MGGYGSGRRIAFKKSVVEDCRWIDVNRWNTEKIIGSVGRIVSWVWRDSEGKQRSSIMLNVLPDVIELSYTITATGEKIKYSVPVNYTTCNYGGERPWFLCPHCGRRVSKLYLSNKYFWCRHCWGLTYESQGENKADRLLRKVQKKRAKLGGSTATVDPIPEKPKGMHQQTYLRKKLEIIDLEERMWGTAAEQFGVNVLW